jgi:hypothetical protein
MVRNYIIIALALALFGCGGGNQLPSSFTVDGTAEKGTLQFGSPVTFYGTDSNFSVQTGNTATAYIDDNLGNYSSTVSLDPGTAYGVVNAYGFYFNENTGSVSSSRINLWSYLLPETGPNNINVATFAIMPRAKVLVQSGSTMAQAIDQASSELSQEILGVPSATGANQWSISGSDPLLAISSIIQQGRSEQAIELILGDLGNDLSDGTLTTANKNTLKTSAQAVDIQQVITNTNAYLATHGGGTVTDFTPLMTTIDPSRLQSTVLNQGMTQSASVNLGTPLYIVIPFTLGAATLIDYASYTCDSDIVEIHNVDPKLGGGIVATGTPSNGALPSRDYGGATPGINQATFGVTLGAGDYFFVARNVASCNLPLYEAVPHGSFDTSSDYASWPVYGTATPKLSLYGG